MLSTLPGQSSDKYEHTQSKMKPKVIVNKMGQGKAQIASCELQVASCNSRVCVLNSKSNLHMHIYSSFSLLANDLAQQLGCVVKKLNLCMPNAILGKLWAYFVKYIRFSNV